MVGHLLVALASSSTHDQSEMKIFRAGVEQPGSISLQLNDALETLWLVRFKITDRILITQIGITWWI